MYIKPVSNEIVGGCPRENHFLREVSCNFNYRWSDASIFVDMDYIYPVHVVFNYQIFYVHLIKEEF